MRKILLFCCFSLFANSFLIAENSVFEIDEEEINAQFEQLNLLEQFLLQHPDLTIFEITGYLNLPVLSSSDIPLIIMSMHADPPWGIPSFIWGLCLSIPGVVIVYTVTNDEKEMKSALMGCLLGTAAYGACYSMSYALTTAW